MRAKTEYRGGGCVATRAHIAPPSPLRRRSDLSRCSIPDNETTKLWGDNQAWSYRHIMRGVLPSLSRDHAVSHLSSHDRSSATCECRSRYDVAALLKQADADTLAVAYNRPSPCSTRSSRHQTLTVVFALHTGVEGPLPRVRQRCVLTSCPPLRSHIYNMPVRVRQSKTRALNAVPPPCAAQHSAPCCAQLCALRHCSHTHSQHHRNEALRRWSSNIISPARLMHAPICARLERRER